MGTFKDVLVQYPTLVEKFGVPVPVDDAMLTQLLDAAALAGEVSPSVARQITSMFAEVQAERAGDPLPHVPFH